MQMLARYYLRALIISTFNTDLYSSYAHMSSPGLEQKDKSNACWVPAFQSHAGKVLNRKSRWWRFLRDTVLFSSLWGQPQARSVIRGCEQEHGTACSSAPPAQHRAASRLTASFQVSVCSLHAVPHTTTVLFIEAPCWAGCRQYSSAAPLTHEYVQCQQGSGKPIITFLENE